MLAAKVIMEQGIQVQGIVFIMQFAARNITEFTKRVKESADEADIPVKFVDMAEEFLKILKDPYYGYGANLNPCIDCKILMLKLAKKMMKTENAGFILTGEVLGERPMSQRKGALNIIQKKSLLDGYLLRPLSAKLLDETIPEKEGVVDRDKLLDLSGRGREKQLTLAKKYRLTKFFAPSGGCLLTDSLFSRKLKDLIDSGNLDFNNIELLKCGRHFRLDNKTKGVVGRDEKDNNSMILLKQKRDAVLRLKDAAGPYVLLRGNLSGKNIQKAGTLLIGHSKSRGQKDALIEYWTEENKKQVIQIGTMERNEIDKMRI